MPQKLNGTIMIGGYGIDNTARKVFDLKITNSWPILSISTRQPQFFRDWTGNTTKLERPNQHLSIPPDLNIHLSPSYKFLHRDLVDDSGELKFDFVYLMGWFSQPIDTYPQPIGTWHQAELFFLTPDKLFSKDTGIFVELFVHRKENELRKILADPFFNQSMRLISNHEPVAVRTYTFKELIRAQLPKVNPNFFLSMRYGFWECRDNMSLIVIKAFSK